MGEINKYSNLYNKDGEFLHSPGNYAIQEVEDLLDGIEDKNSQEYQNTMAVLMQMYERHGNPHKDEILQKINDYASSKTTKAEIVDALNDLKDGETPNAGEEEEIPGTAGSSTEESGGVQERNTDSESSIAA